MLPLIALYEQEITFMKIKYVYISTQNPGTEHWNNLNGTTANYIMSQFGCGLTYAVDLYSFILLHIYHLQSDVIGNTKHSVIDMAVILLGVILIRAAFQVRILHTHTHTCAQPQKLPRLLTWNITWNILYVCVNMT